MCGICGFNWEDKELGKLMMRSLEHRGPDGGGLYSDKNVTLGHRRLSIIDLSEAGKQPMPNEAGTMLINYNGEIYNFQELREELEKCGHQFFSDTDTEVILHGYEQWGEDVLQKLNGMFAFCIYDIPNKKMFLARDRVGVKPLYYYKDKNKLLKQRLRNPSRGLSKDGVIVKIKNDQSPDLYFSEIHYDYSGRKIRINFNGNWFDLVLDHNDFSLKYQDGGPLNLDEESMLWWENVILSPLEKLVCNGDEKDWLIAGTENLPTDKALEIKKRTITKRIGYSRREPPGRGYTEEQRNRVLSARKFSLFGIEIIDLKLLNEERGLTRQEGQYTYVLPIEQEPTGTPVEVSVPAAFDF